METNFSAEKKDWKTFDLNDVLFVEINKVEIKQAYIQSIILTVKTKYFFDDYRWRKMALLSRNKSTLLITRC